MPLGLPNCVHGVVSDLPSWSKIWMRLLPRSPTKMRPRESMAMAWMEWNSPGAQPLLPHALTNAPSFENFTMRLLPLSPWPSATKTSPLGADDDVARGGEVVGPAPLLSRRAERHQHLPGRAELDDDVTAFVALRDAVGRDRVGHPDVAVPVDVDAVRPDEHAAAEALHDLAVGAELHDRIGLRVAALVAEPRRDLPGARSARPPRRAGRRDRSRPCRPRPSACRSAACAQPSTMRYGFGNPCAPTRGTPDDMMRANANSIPACSGFCMFCTSLAGSGDYTPGHMHRVVVRHWGPHGPEHRRHRRKRPFRSPGPQGGEVRRAHVGRARTRRHDRRSRAVEPAAARSDVQGVPKGEAPAPLETLATLYRSADAFVVVSGEYNHSIPPALSNLLDHFLEEYFWRPSAIVCYSAGAFGGVRAAMQLRAMLCELGMPSIPSLFPIPKVRAAFDDEGRPLTQRSTGDSSGSPPSWSGTRQPCARADRRAFLTRFAGMLGGRCC